MTDISRSAPSELPSSRTLARSTVLAMAVAGLLLGVVVLPAEYGVDPTGVGGALGLKRMGEIKSSLAEEARAAETVSAAPSTTEPAPCAPAEAAPAASAPAPEVVDDGGAQGAVRSETATIALEPNQGREIKLSMREGARVTFSWSTDRGVVNYDQHADSKEPPRPYHGYRKAVGVASDSGELVAAFDGWHGWFWRNRGTETVAVTLRVEGELRELREMK